MRTGGNLSLHLSDVFTTVHQRNFIFVGRTDFQALQHFQQAALFNGPRHRIVARWSLRMPLAWIVLFVNWIEQ